MMEDFNRDKKKKDKLMRSTLFDGKDEVPIQELIRERTDDLAKTLKEKASSLKMNYFDTKKNFI